MTEEITPYTKVQHAHHMEERKALVDAARESSRTFDQAILAFGAAVFGASVAFLKDVAPKPQAYTIEWLGISWACFTAGLLAVILSFLFSHKACLVRIDESAHLMCNPKAKPLGNRWATWTELCNYLCVALLFFGVIAWTVFALENLAAPTSGGKNEQPASATIGGGEKGPRSAENRPSAPTGPISTPTSAASQGLK
ncbi:hypothetical protein [Terracidiphilus gabretensis]|uniref:hypothetical protein n=1 Tax=Terracidiphilus gabretensis TaxID=1577687 RepID=UPI00071BE3C1|nr:hypothetical protein [Terracidiphilus gabretensis]